MMMMILCRQCDRELVLWICDFLNSLLWFLYNLTVIFVYAVWRHHHCWGRSGYFC